MPPEGTIGSGGGADGVRTTQSTAVRSSDGASTDRGTGTGGVGSRRTFAVVRCWRSAVEENRVAGNLMTNNPLGAYSAGEEQPSDRGPSRVRLLPRSKCCMGVGSVGTATGDPGHQNRHRQGRIDPEKIQEVRSGTVFINDDIPSDNLR